MWMLPHHPVWIGKIEGDRVEAVIVSSWISTHDDPLRGPAAEEVRQVVQPAHEVDLDVKTIRIRNSNNRLSAGLHDVENQTDSVVIESAARYPFVEVEADRAARTQFRCQRS